MPEAPTPPETQADVRPWRKRHPVLSRSILYGLGLGLAVLLLVLFTDQKEDDERVRIEALQKELDALSLLMATDPTGQSVLAQLDEKFSASDLPVITQARALRWRAMAWRRGAQHADAQGDEAAKQAAIQAAEKALAAADALKLPPAERVALRLEWAEALFEREELARARKTLPRPEELTTVPQALLATLLRAQGLRLEDKLPASLKLVAGALESVDVPIGTEQQDYVGGRTWSALQLAVELAGYLTAVGEPAAAVGAWNRLRAAAPHDYETQKAAALALTQGGASDDALAAWRAARSINGRLAGVEAAREPVLAALEKRLRAP